MNPASEIAFPRIGRAYSESAIPPFLAGAIFLSLCLHIVLVVVLSKSNFDGEPRPLEAINVSFEMPQLSKSETRQIVSETAQRADQNPDDRPRFLSDKDASVEKQQLKRGEGLDAGALIGKPPAAPEQPQAKPERAPGKAVIQPPGQEQGKLNRKEALKENAPPKQMENDVEAAEKKLKYLRLDDSTLSRKLAGADTESRSANKALQEAVMGQLPNERTGTAVQPFSRPFGSGARFMGRTGSSDFLPNLPDGDVTLLNTKANLFAVFVRRVALQVFGELRNSGWEHLSARDILAMSKECSVNAVMNMKGDLLRVFVDTPSGSFSFDNVLLNAVRKAARDPNPPAAAAAGDGNIHFIFQSKSWVQTAGDPRSGAPVERRWLLLSTGLE